MANTECFKIEFLNFSYKIKNTVINGWHTVFSSNRLFLVHI